MRFQKHISYFYKDFNTLHETCERHIWTALQLNKHGICSYAEYEKELNCFHISYMNVWCLLTWCVSLETSYSFDYAHAFNIIYVY